MSEVFSVELEPRFAALRRALEVPRTRAAPVKPSVGEAAVALVLRACEDLELLLIKRAESERDPWSGHMALPGGRRDPDDRSLLETAIRETVEETGVRLDGATVSLGRLADVTPMSRRVPSVQIAPFVFGVAPHTEARPNSHEVDATYWVPLSTLFHPDSVGRKRLIVGDEHVVFPAFLVEGERVWGLTHRILTGFLDLLDGVL